MSTLTRPDIETQQHDGYIITISTDNDGFNTVSIWLQTKIIWRRISNATRPNLIQRAQSWVAAQEGKHNDRDQ